MERFDISQAPLEIERKFLIRYPRIEEICAMDGYRVRHIEQTYLQADGDFAGGRIRRISEDGCVWYVYTYKLRLSDMTRREYEREISEAEYLELLPHQEEGTITIVKDRHIFRYQDLTYELDVYDFWDDQATLEAEVDREDTPIPLPPCVELIREVTHDRSYSNASLARQYGAAT